MDSDSEVPFAATLTPVFSLNSKVSGSEQQCPKVWGRLFPTRLFLTPVDLKDNCSFGRGLDCNIIFSPRNFDKKCLSVVSKIHFKITCEEEYVFIEDCSKNGTFINNVPIKNKKVLLQNDDEISIGIAKLTVYVFKKFRNEDDCYLPDGLRQKYEISRLLGKGAFGEVRLAFSKTNCEQFAIKKMCKGNTSLGNIGGSNSKSRVLNEVSILKSLAHPCIISMFDFLETDNAVFMVLEYMEGGELTKHIISTKPPLSEARSKLIFYQIVLGVQYLHSQGITHRDLKPGNILLKTNEEETLVKVSDFGLSKIVESNIFMATICGTPMFAAPEVVDISKQNYNQQIDIWSLGVILFYMLSKDMPFKAEVRSQLFYLILNAEYDMEEEKWRYISEDAKALIRQMLVKDPQNRITIGDVAKHFWMSEDIIMQETVMRLIKAAAVEKSTAYFNSLRTQDQEETLPLR